MQRSPVVIAVTAGALALIGVPGPATATAAADRHRQLHLIEHELTSRVIDLGSRGLSVGDRQEIHSDILDTSHHRVGSLDDDCGITSVAGHRLSAACTGILSLPRGSLTVTFGGPIASIGAQAVTGGSGRFEGAHGEIRLTGPEGKLTPFLIDLLPN